MAKKYKVLVSGDKNNLTLDIQQGAGDRGQPVRVKAQVGAKYQLQEEGRIKGSAPDSVRVKRHGKHLEITFEDGTQPDLIIENYYGEMPPGYQGVVGEAENGSIYDFVAEDPALGGQISSLGDGVEGISAVLGSSEAGAGAAVAVLAPLISPGLLAAAGGAAAAAAAGGGGGGSTPAAAVPAAPAAPSSYKDNVGAVQANSSTASTTDDTSPGINIGSVPTGTTPNLYIDGVKVPATYDPATGTLTPITPLTDGPHTLTYTLSNTAGESGQSAPLNLTVDTSAPSAPTNSGIDNVGGTQGTIPTNGTTDDNTPTFGGTAEPGSTVNVYDNGVLIGRAVTNGSGVWSFTPTTPLADGPHSITTNATDAAGNTGPSSPELPFTVDATAPVAPTVNSQTTNDTTPVLTGTAEAGSTVTVTVGGATYKVVANSAGLWTIDTGTATPLSGTFNLGPDGLKNIGLASTDAAGNSTPGNGNITLDTTPPATPTFTATDDVSPVTGDITGGGHNQRQHANSQGHNRPWRHSEDLRQRRAHWHGSGGQHRRLELHAHDALGARPTQPEHHIYGYSGQHQRQLCTAAVHGGHRCAWQYPQRHAKWHTWRHSCACGGSF
jgi:hypothetical protein